MRFISRFAAVLTAAALTVSVCVPAFAAEKAPAKPAAKAGYSGTFTGSTDLTRFLHTKLASSPESIAVPTAKLGGGSATTMFQKLGDAAEEAFVQSGMVDHITSFDYRYEGGSSVKLTLQYADKKADSRKASASALTKKADAVVKATIVAGMTDAQKATALYDYVSANVAYDYAALNDFLEKDTGANFYVKQTAHSALVDGKAICQGFAKAYKLLCDKAGVPCVTVFGTTKRAGGGTVGHAWNRVYLDGKWQTVDTTNRQLNICAQDGIIIPAATAAGILTPNKQWMLDKELAKFS